MCVTEDSGGVRGVNGDLRQNQNTLAYYIYLKMLICKYWCCLVALVENQLLSFLSNQPIFLNEDSVLKEGATSLPCIGLGTH